MNEMRRIGDNKRAVSLIVSYVLLITIGIALSGLVYTWLRFYVGVEDTDACPDGVSLIVKDYTCDETEGTLEVVLKNNGRFKVDGFVLKVSNRSGADIGSYRYFSDPLLEEIYYGEEISPGNEKAKMYAFSDFEKGNVGTVTLIKVQPFVNDNGKRVYCEAVSSQDVECS
jgi:hypothetical protein